MIYDRNSKVNNISLGNPIGETELIVVRIKVKIQNLRIMRILEGFTGLEIWL